MLHIAEARTLNKVHGILNVYIKYRLLALQYRFSHRIAIVSYNNGNICWCSCNKFSCLYQNESFRYALFSRDVTTTCTGNWCIGTSPNKKICYRASMPNSVYQCISNLPSPHPLPFSTPHTSLVLTLSKNPLLCIIKINRYYASLKLFKVTSHNDSSVAS